MELCDTFIFYVTTGRGTENFVEEEIKQKMQCHVVKKRDGKVFFSVPHNQYQYKTERLFALKSVERIFIAICDYNNSHFITDKRTFLDKLMYEMSAIHNFSNAQKLVDEIKIWHSTCNCSHRKSHHNIATCKFCDNCYSKNKGEPSLQTYMPESSKITSCEEVPPLKKLKKVDILVDRGKLDTFSFEDLNKPPPAESLQKLESDLPFNSSNANIQDQVLSTSFKNPSSEMEADVKRFRISVKCSGKVKRWLDLKRLSKDLAWRIAKASGWRVDLHHPDFEVCIHINDDYVTAGIPLTKFPLSKREYIDSGLRTTIAWIMCYLAKITPDDIVLDPMCGKATVLLEARSDFNAVMYLGSDLDQNFINAAKDNTSRQISCQAAVSLVLADGLNLPYRDGCIDVVVCDTPFNQKHKIRQDNTELFYLQFLKEVYRVLAPDGRCVLLVRHDMKETLTTKLINGLMSPHGSKEFDESHSVQSHVPFIYVESHFVKLANSQNKFILLPTAL
ncbi:hypothetical protein Btru_064948 [Bulinus truncatus]|nr:hypothetical protein Btru_064948 [Bulinus truncatus]